MFLPPHKRACRTAPFTRPFELLSSSPLKRNMSVLKLENTAESLEPGEKVGVALDGVGDADAVACGAVADLSRHSASMRDRGVTGELARLVSTAAPVGSN